MQHFTRITQSPSVMGGRPCIRGMSLTVGSILELLAEGRTVNEIITVYPYLEPADVQQSLAYAAWRLDRGDVPAQSAPR
ncbi:MAG: DUF433 domain-containing protein [Phormidesmis sp.]